MGSNQQPNQVNFQNNSGLQGLQNYVNSQNDPRVQALLSGVGTGSMSIQDALSAIQGMQGGQADPGLQNQVSTLAAKVAQEQKDSDFANATSHSTGEPTQLAQDKAQLNSLQNQLSSQSSGQGLSEAALNALGTNGITGSKLAQQMVLQDPTLAGLFNQGGLLNQAETNYGTDTGNLASDRQALMGNDQSYGLTNQDLQAYGQASDAAARQFGSEANSLAQQLASQGLSSSANPAASLYSGLLGNQNEQLANAQLQIAQNRINTAQSLAQARTNADLQAQAQAGNLATNLGNLGQNAVQSQYGRQLEGAQNTYNQLAGLGSQTQGQQVAQQNANNTAAQIANQPTFGQNLLGALAGGIAGAAPGALVSAFKPAANINIGTGR